MLVALLALVMACGGSAVAASLITSQQIKDGTIQTKDISTKALKSLKGKTGSRGLQGLPGAPGQKGDTGPQGPKGDKGDTGPSTGAAGGDLAGNYPNPTIKNGAVTPDKIGSLPAAKVTLTSDQAVSGGSDTNLAWDSALYDTSGFFDPAAKTVLTAPRAGIYLLQLNVRWAASATGLRWVSISAGGNVLAESTNPGGFGDSQSVSAVAKLAAGDQITTSANQTSGGSLNIRAFSEASTLSATWLSSGT